MTAGESVSRLLETPKRIEDQHGPGVAFVVSSMTMAEPV
jgi:hypothetical protein